MAQTGRFQKNLEIVTSLPRAGRNRGEVQTA